MFSTTSVYRGINCPLQDQCDALNCLFAHPPRQPQPVPTSQPLEQGTEQLRPLKRRRLSPDLDRKRSQDGSAHESLATPKPAFVGQMLPRKSVPDHKSDRETKIAKSNVAAASVDRNVSNIDRPISPPVIQRRTKPSGPPQEEKREELNPRTLERSPATHQHRFAYLKKIHESMVKHNKKVADDPDPATKALRLTDGQVIKLALDEEERIARENPTIYANVIKMRIVILMKMSLEDWKAARLKDKNAPQAASSSPSTGNVLGAATPPKLTTGLELDQEFEVLHRLIANQNGLDKYGYVTSVPDKRAIEKAEEIVTIGLNWEKCERCQGRFQVFPDRREEDGAVTTGGKCTYHHGRQQLTMKDPTGYSKTRSKVWGCCDEPVGASRGCTEAESHVFKISDTGRLASIMQFATTPENSNVPADRVITFDCEMGYTSNGMELLRLTAISWPEAETLLDVLVRPLGIILDLNTRFSGVSPEQFGNAPPYNPKATAPGDLQIVESPRAARQLLFDLISPSTPLIGHAIENDLNATRIVHPTIIDTVLAFPHPAGLPARNSLRALTAQHLSRQIQQAGAAGHDSKEDCIATGDLVRFKVKSEWRQMKRDGWKAPKGGGNLIPPNNKG